MKLEKRIEEKYSVLKPLEENINSRIAPRLKKEFIFMQSSGVQNIIVNMEEVKYTDSSGLSAFLFANRLCKNASGLLVISNVNPHVMKLIKISHLQTVFTILPTEKEAVECVFMHELEKEMSQQEDSDASSAL